MEETQQQQQKLRRSLKARHMNMIAIGGAIGTGLFVAGGETVSTAGPGGHSSLTHSSASWSIFL